MKIRTIIIVMLAIAALLFGVGYGLNQAGNSKASDQTDQISPDGQSSDKAADESPQVSQTPQTNTTAAPTSSADGNQSDKDSLAVDPQAQPPRPSWDPKPSAPDRRLEIKAESSPSPSGLPSTEPRTDVLKKAPKAATAEGKLTKGFPKKALPLPQSSDVEKSSVSVQSSMVMVGVQGRSKQSVEDVLAFYESHFKDLQWLASTSTDADGSTRLQAGFGQDTATVTLHQLPTGLTEINAAGVFKVED